MVGDDRGEAERLLNNNRNEGRFSLRPSDGEGGTEFDPEPAPRSGRDEWIIDLRKAGVVGVLPEVRGNSTGPGLTMYRRGLRISLSKSFAISTDPSSPPLASYISRCM